MAVADMDIQPLTLDFVVPPELEAGEPPEARGLPRDGVRLMVSHHRDDRIDHTTFDRLPDHLDPGDLLVINTSGTLNAALDAVRAGGSPVELHLSTRLAANVWTVELRPRVARGDLPGVNPYGTYLSGYNLDIPRDTQSSKFERHIDRTVMPARGEVLTLPAGATATLQAPYRSGCDSTAHPAWDRLWIARLDLPIPTDEYLARHGFPIRYSYVKQQWPSSYYQTVYATEMGSAEMPSAGRAFTPDLLARLVKRGVQIAPLLLHTGVASPEVDEPPYEERYRVPAKTAQIVNATRAHRRRVVAVGTTVVRALETVTDEGGTAHPGEGWTCVVVRPSSAETPGLRAVDGLLTGFHEPRSSHLSMLEALAGLDHLQITYAEALSQRYLWHEFGDLHLILP